MLNNSADIVEAQEKEEQKQELLDEQNFETIQDLLDIKFLLIET